MDESPERPTVWPVFLAFAAAMAALVVGGVVVVMAYLVVGVARGQTKANASGAFMDGVVRSPGFLLWTTLLSNAVFALTALIAVRLERRPAAQRLRWLRARTRWPHVVAAVLLVLGLSETSDRVIALLGLQLGATMQHLGTAVHGSSPPVFLGLALLLVLAGLSEELFFRGYMQTRLGWRWTRGVAVIVTAGFFGLAHLDPVHSSATLAMGIALGAVTEASGSVRPAVAAHCVNNLFAALSARYLVGTWYAAAHLSVLGAGLLALALGALWLWRLALSIPREPV